MNTDDKLLYITNDFSHLAPIGGVLVRKIHEEALKMIFYNRIHEFLLDFKPRYFKTYLYKLFFLYFPGITFSIFKRIKTIINKTSPNIVFMESSQHGNLVKYIKKRYPRIYIVTNFINIELHYAKTLSAYNPKNWWFYLMAKVNETQAVKFSDKCIVLNERDAGEMWKLYKRKADCVLPISLKDTIDNNTLCSLNETRHLINSHNCLFVGSRFEANVRGLTWFIKNVLPFVDLHLYIIGQGMSKSFKNTGNITVKDFVQDLKEDYVNIDFVIEPIFAGGGMKTKTAEAMMWGKALIGTDEAFIGYEIDNIHGLYRCNTAREMIEAIQDIYDDDIWNFNPCIRDLFLKKYSFENTIKTLSDFFNSL